MRPWPTSDFQLLAPLIVYGDPVKVREVLRRREAARLTLPETIAALALCCGSASGQGQLTRRGEERAD
jgi:hypothetical protein